MKVESNGESDGEFGGTLGRLDHYLKTKLRPKVNSHLMSADLSQDFIDFLYQNGIIQLLIPKNLGGRGATMQELCQVVRILGGTSNGLASIYIGTLLSLTPLMRYGSRRLQLHVCEQFLSKPQVGAFAMTESDSGIDVANISTYATQEGDKFILNGEKHFISNTALADHFVVFARLGEAGITAFYLPKDSAGLKVVKSYRKLGNRELNVGMLRFENVSVPETQILGSQGQGLEILAYSVSRSKTLLAAASVGLAQRAVEITVQSLQSKVRQGKPLLYRPDIQAQLVHHQTQIDASWLLAQQSARDFDAKQSAVKSAAQAKLFATDAAVNTVNDCMELVGAASYLDDHELGRLMRDVKLLEIYEGSSTVQRAIIGRELFRGQAGAKNKTKRAA